MLTSFIPYSSALRFLRQREDTTRRVRSGVGNRVLDALPLLSSSLPAKYDWITGQLDTSSYLPDTSEYKEDEVLTELVLAGNGVRGAPLRRLQGINLSDEQYARLLELHGTIRLNGKTLYQSLEEVINSPGYDKARNTIGDALIDELSPRARMLDKVIDTYRRQATAVLLQEDTALRERIISRRREKWMQQRGLTATPGQRSVYATLLQGR